MSNNLYAASQQWASRPQDERFGSLAELLADCEADDARMVTGHASVGVLRAEANGSALQVRGQNSVANLTNWSYGQLAATAGAPAAYLRTLPADLAAQCVNHGLARLTDEGKRERHQLYIRRPNGDGTGPMVIRALTSDSYTRVLDSSIVRRLAKIQEGQPSWQLPMTWDHKREGAYRGDRDMFVILTEGGSIVEDPTLSGGNGAMFRGIIVRNSEVGSACLTLETFLFRYICGNHIIWGASQVRTFKRRHVGQYLESDFGRTFRQAAIELTNRAASDDVAIIKRLADTTIAKDKDTTIATLRKAGLSETLATQAYDSAEANEPAGPRSAWGIIQGITRVSQNYQNQDDRWTLDMLAGKLTRQYAYA